MRVVAAVALVFFAAVVAVFGGIFANAVIGGQP